MWQSYSFGEHIALWTDDQVYHFDISLDLESDRWTVAVDGAELYANRFNTSELESIRFNLAPSRPYDYDVAGYPASYVALNNVVVTAVPEPSAVVLLAMGLAALLNSMRRNVARRQSPP